MKPSIRFRVALLIALLVCGGMWRGGQSAALDSATVRATDGAVYAAGPPVALAVTVANVQGLGAATVMVSYDPALLTVVGCQRNAAFDVGLCNISYDRDKDGIPDAVLFNVVSLMGVTAGATGVALVNVSWQAVANVATATATTLSVQVLTFTDADGRSLPAAGQDGVLTIQPALPTPTPTSTPTPTPSPTPTPTPTPTPSPTSTTAPPPTATPPHGSRIYLPLMMRGGPGTALSSAAAFSAGTATPTPVDCAPRRF